MLTVHSNGNSLIFLMKASGYMLGNREDCVQLTTETDKTTISEKNSAERYPNFSLSGSMLLSTRIPTTTSNTGVRILGLKVSYL